MLLCLGEPPRRFFVMLVAVLHFIFDLYFVVVSSFNDVLHFILVSSFVVFLHSHFLLDVIPHPSVDYRRVFTPILYFQPSPSQSDSRHFHFQLFRDLLFTVLPRGLRFWVGIFYPHALFTLCSFTNILLAFIKASLGAGSSSLKLSGLHTDPRSTDLTHLFVWFTVIHNLYI